MGNRSKDLLRLEHNKDSSSLLESSLLVCGQKKKAATFAPNPDLKPSIGPLPKSQVLGKVKDFLGVFAESNRRLEQDAKENADAVDIEFLSGNETNVIEMDLMLGIADLNTPEALAAAESTVDGYQPVIPLASSTSGTDSGSESDDSDSSNTDEESGSDDEKQRSSEVEKTESWDKGAKRKQPYKRQKIIELP